MVLLAVEAQQTLLVAEMADLPTPVDGLQQLPLALTSMAPGSLRVQTGRSDLSPQSMLRPSEAPRSETGSHLVTTQQPVFRAVLTFPRVPPYLAVPQQVLAFTVLAAEVPGAAIQLLGDTALAGLGAVSTSDTAKSQLLSEVLFV